jgi:hypothetical protein
MKKLLLLFIGFIGFSMAALAQPQGGTCVPNSQYADSVYGAWPDTTTNFPSAQANVYYETILNFKAPATVTADLDPSGQFVGSPIQTYKVTSVVGLPVEYTYACNVGNCTYNGGTQGCATVYGTTATTGTYNVTINLDVTVLVTLFPGFPPTPVTQQASFTGYRIKVCPPLIQQTITEAACQTFTSPFTGQSYNQSGTYQETLTNTSGCDSVLVTLNLTVNNLSSSSISYSTCDPYDWNGQVYNSTGVYTATLTNALGCDSVVTLNLTINSTTNSITQSACASYLWNNNTYTSSGVYVDTLVNAAGCDSIETLYLTIFNGVSDVTTQTACNSYNWNGQTYSQSGVYTSLDTCAGSVNLIYDTLILTINNNFSNTVTVAECSSYNWNGQTYTASGTYTYAGQTSAGCDSVVTLNLTINNVTATATLNSANNTISASPGISYQWINCAGNSPISGATNQIFSPTANGSYAVIVTSNDCSDTSNCVVVAGLGIKEIDSQNLLVKPNPASSEITIQGFKQTLKVKSISITNIEGRVVLMKSVLDDTNSVIDISNLRSGIYFVNVIYSDGISKVKFVKE